MRIGEGLNKLEQYWATKRAVWSPTTYAAEVSRYKVLKGAGFPEEEPGVVFEKLSAVYGRYTLKQFFIRAKQVEAVVFGSRRYADWFMENKVAFKGCYTEKTRSLTEDEVRLLLQYTKEFFPHLLNFFVLMAFGGLRKSEALNVRKEDIDVDRELLFVHQGKGRKNRSVPFPKEFQSFLLFSGDGPYLCMRGNFRVRRPDRALKTISHNTGVKFTPHDLRAFAITRFSKYLNIWELSEFAGHSSVNTTKKYVRINSKDVTNKLRGAV